MNGKKLTIAALAAVLCWGGGGIVQAQQTPNAPMGEFQARSMDTGQRANAADRPAVAFADLVHTPGAAWTRLYFSQLDLEGDSRIRFTSLLDGEVQELDAAGVEMWDKTSAYFNGDTVLVELIAAPGTHANRAVLRKIGVEMINHQEIGLCGICNTDTRVPSDEDWAARMAPGGCSAAVFNVNSCMVSAGHCMSGNNVVQFRVPNSLGNCQTQNPPIADQFPILSGGSNQAWQNGGVGNDWAVFRTGINSQHGQTIYERYGQFRPIASQPAPVNGAVQVWGYGASLTCNLTHTQQLSEGVIVQRNSTIYSHTADTTGGNSGSAILHNNEIIGVVTHCPCPNIANRIDHPPFADAINNICPDPTPVNNTCPSSIILGEGATPFTNFAATTTGPDEGDICNFFNDSQIQSDVWFGHVATCTGNLTISLCNSSYNTKLGIYPLACPTSPGTIIACNTISDACDLNRSEITIPVTQGEAFRIRVGGHAGAQGDGILEISCEPAQPTCTGDLNGDGIVNVSDLLILLGAWGDCSGCDEDLNGDSVVNVSDLLILLGEWGVCD